MAEPIRVLVADDHAIVRAGVRLALAEVGDMVVAGEAATGDEAQRLCRELQPDVLLLDLSMPGPPAAAVVAYLRAHCPGTRIVMLTAFDDDAHVRALVGLGVAGYVLKDDTVDAIAAAVRAVAAGSTWFSRAVLPALLARPHEVKGGALTPREREVLALLAAGQSNQSIAATLGVGVRTAEFHVKNVLLKLGAHSRTEALHQAHRRGLLPPDTALPAGA